MAAPLTSPAESAPPVIRCPVCLTAHWTRPATTPDEAVRCTHCKKAYLLRKWIRTADQVTGEAIVKLPIAKTARQSSSADNAIPLLFLMIVGGLIGWYLQPLIAGAGVPGPEFLWILFMVGLFSWGATIMLRLMWVDSWQVVVAGILLFELFGIHRYLWGSSVGMTTWSFTAVMLCLGWLPYLIFLRSPGYVLADGTWMPTQMTSSGTCSGGMWWLLGCSSSSCSGGSGCSGGGGCGGGGCGGCGGS